MWFTNLFTNGGVGTTVLMLSISIFSGLLLGKIKFKGITLGITWVLFVGIALSACGVACNHDMLHIIKEFGLILFVTAVGLQVGPGFFRSFKKGGLAMNLLALANVALGVGLTVLIAKLSGEDLVSMAGVYTGAVTNTPGMSAAQQTVAELGLDKADVIANGYAVAYPLAVVGMILTCIVMRPLCRIELAKEATEDTNDHALAKPTNTAAKPKVQLIPIFLVIAIGIILGSIPIPVGMSAPVKLGLAGGPLVAALVGSWWSVKKGWLTTDFIESHGVSMVRELGIALFLAGVGLSAGSSFIETIQAGGYMWVLYGFIITVVPPMVVALFARLVLHVNYYTLMGFIGGSHTDPPTLAFANTVAPEGCKLPNVGYATVYPLTMFLRIFTAQMLVLMAL